MATDVPPSDPLLRCTFDDFPDNVETVVDRDRIARDLRDAASRVESLVVAAQQQLDLVPGGSPAGHERRVKRVMDLMRSAREAATRLLEVSEQLG